MARLDYDPLFQPPPLSSETKRLIQAAKNGDKEAFQAVTGLPPVEEPPLEVGFTDEQVNKLLF